MSDVEYLQAAIARTVAIIAHRGQVDKSGAPYIHHPRRVAAATAGDHGKAVAWLHDVLEDSDITAADLQAVGIDQAVIVSVVLLTRVKGQSSTDYYRDLSGDYYGRLVKLADMRDNLNPARLALLDDATIGRLVRKYAKGFELLGGHA